MANGRLSKIVERRAWEIYETLGYNTPVFLEPGRRGLIKREAMAYGARPELCGRLGDEIDQESN